MAFCSSTETTHPKTEVWLIGHPHKKLPNIVLTTVDVFDTVTLFPLQEFEEDCIRQSEEYS